MNSLSKKIRSALNSASFGLLFLSCLSCTAGAADPIYKGTTEDGRSCFVSFTETTMVKDVETHKALDPLNDQPQDYYHVKETRDCLVLTTAEVTSGDSAQGDGGIKISSFNPNEVESSCAKDVHRNLLNKGFEAEWNIPHVKIVVTQKMFSKIPQSIEISTPGNRDLICKDLLDLNAPQSDGAALAEPSDQPSEEPALHSDNAPVGSAL